MSNLTKEIWQKCFNLLREERELNIKFGLHSVILKILSGMVRVSRETIIYLVNQCEAEKIVAHIKLRFDRFRVRRDA